MSDTREDLEARIAAYIDGQLPPAEAARLEVFLANTDPQLAEQIIAMLGDRHNLRDLPKPKAPPELSARILEQVERAALLNDIPHHEHQPRPWWHSRLAIAAGFTILIGGFSYFVVRSVVGPGDKTNPTIAENHPPAVNTLAAPETTIAMAPAGPAAPLPTAAAPEALKSSPDNAEKIASAGPSPKSAESPPKIIPTLPVLPGDAAATQFDHAPDKDLAQAEKTEFGLQTQLARNSDLLRTNQASAAKLGYAAVDSPAKALANISARPSTPATETIIMTLVARDDRDFARLQAALESIMTQDPLAPRRQVALQTRYLNVLNNGGNANGNYFTNANRTRNNTEGNLAINNTTTINNGNNTINNNSGGANYGNVHVDSIANNSGNASSQAAVTNTAPTFSGKLAPAADGSFDNAVHYKIYSPKDRDFADVPPAPGNEHAKTGNEVAAVAGATTQPPAPDRKAQAPEAAGEHTAASPAKKDLAEEKEQLAAADQPHGPAGGQRQGGGKSETQTKAADDAQQNQQTNGTRENWESPSVPFYRVELRPEQLDQLAREFRVDSITSGHQAYVITPETQDHPQATEDLASAEHPPLDKAKQQSLKTQSKADAPTEAHANEEMETSSQKLADEKPAATAPTTRPATPSSSLDHLDDSKDGPWLECIITMQPRPVAPTQQQQSK